MFKNLKLGAKIGLGFTAVLLILASMAVLSYRQQLGAFGNFTHYRQLAKENILAAEINQTMLDIRIQAKEFFYSKDKAAEAKYQKDKDLLLKYMERAKMEVATPARTTIMATIDEAYAQYDKEFQALQQLAAKPDASQQFAAAYGRMLTLGPTIAKACFDLQELVTQGQVELGDKVRVNSERTLRWLVWISLAAVLAGCALGYAITRSISRPIQAIIETLSAGADQTAAASLQVSAASQSLAEGSSEQAASLEETSSSLEEMASMTKRNADNASKANELADQARQASDAGATQMKALNEAMEAIKSSSADISKIIKTIDEIAFQTNILALNAAVEAARAGEAGMGFAVVADEVRNLAQRSAQAAKDTTDKIEGAISKTMQGVEISVQVAAVLRDITGKVRQVDELVSEVASASREQSQGIDQVNSAVTQMDKVTQSVAASAEESASASEELSSQAESLREAVAQLSAMVMAATAASASAKEPRRVVRAPVTVGSRPNRAVPANGSAKIIRGGVSSGVGEWTAAEEAGEKSDASAMVTSL
jgi:methyl-accepting chemotaxis protein